ncbi:MAG: class I SAM-dependent methyltransferase [Deltaproteobacteria bacterium]|nr:class I SAM-dependent methyltransferase [Deltaproteobacteria bacterium]
MVIMKSLYSEEEIKRAYKDIDEHIKTKYIITKYSTNPSDIRDVALDGLGLSETSNVLDIGCGYGFFIERLKGLLKRGAIITGLDVLEDNGAPFLDNVSKAGYSGRFIKGSADIVGDIEDSIFDLVIASYSLYFFPHLIKEISRILRPDGLFIAVTHSKFSINEVIRLIFSAMKKEDISPPETTSIFRLFEAFSLEDGKSQLGSYFKKVERIIFKNALIFPLEGVEECISYLHMKQHLLFKEVLCESSQKAEDMINHVYQDIYRHVQQKGAFKITKDDAIFRCFKPKNI